MQLGMIGLGKMGYALAMNAMEHGHEVTAYDVSAESLQRFEQEGGSAVGTLSDLVGRLAQPRLIWVMVPAERTEQVLEELKLLLGAGDRVIDGGNSHYKQSVERAAVFAELGIDFFDVGTSGGVEGARNGACAMVGGKASSFREIEPLFRDLCVPNGYHYAGESGSGHFLKMVHNGIEYGMMQSIAEGFEILHKSPYDFDYEQVAKVWNNGSVIRSWLMELIEEAFAQDAKLDRLRGVMQSSGEGKWTVEAALELQTAAPVIALSLMMRYRSLEEDTFSGKVVAALRNGFGGHGVVPHSNTP